MSVANFFAMAPPDVARDKSKLRRIFSEKHILKISRSAALTLYRMEKAGRLRNLLHLAADLVRRRDHCLAKGGK